jgi:hypothetical protein
MGNTEIPFWRTLAGKALTDFLETAIAVFGTINVAVFLQFVTITAAGIRFDRAGAVDELAIIVPSVAVGVAGALVSAVRRQIPAAQERLGVYWQAFLARLKGN